MRYRLLLIDHDDTAVDSTAVVHYPAHLEALRVLRPGVPAPTIEEWWMANFEPGIMEHLVHGLGMDEAGARSASSRSGARSPRAGCRRSSPACASCWLISARGAAGSRSSRTRSGRTSSGTTRSRATRRSTPDLVFGWEHDPARRKPDPWPVREALSRLGVPPAEALVLDDLRPGVLMARAAGVDAAARGMGSPGAAHPRVDAGKLPRRLRHGGGVRRVPAGLRPKEFRSRPARARAILESVPDEKRNPLKLLEASERLYQIKDLDALLERVLSEARAFVNADAGTLYMASGNNLYFSFVQNDTLFRGETKDKYIPSGASLPIDKASIAGYVARTGEAMLIDDVYHIQSKVTFAFNPSFDRETNYRTKSILAVPLKTRDEEIVGVLQLINAKDDAGDDRRLLDARPHLHLGVRPQRRRRHRAGPPVARDGAAHGGAGRAARPVRDQPARQARRAPSRWSCTRRGRPAAGSRRARCAR